MQQNISSECDDHFSHFCLVDFIITFSSDHSPAVIIIQDNLKTQSFRVLSPCLVVQEQKCIGILGTYTQSGLSHAACKLTFCNLALFKAVCAQCVKLTKIDAKSTQVYFFISEICSST